jgi:hypothetical protein
MELDSIHLDQDKGQWPALVNKVMNFLVPLMADQLNDTGFSRTRLGQFTYEGVQPIACGYKLVKASYLTKLFDAQLI